MTTPQDKTRHTPVPWKRGPYGGIYQVHPLKAVGGCHNPKGVPHDNWNADEKFIVKACNNHAALVEALEIAREYIKAILQDGYLKQTNKLDLNKIDAALAAVEGE